MTYQKGAVSYAELVEFFYRTHEPTQADGQGNDRGEREFTFLLIYKSPTRSSYQWALRDLS